MSNPLDLRGPEFLGLYLAFATIAIALAFALRYVMRPPYNLAEDKVPNLSPYEVAYLGGGPERAAQAAVARLVQDGYAKVDASVRQLKRTPKAFPEQGAHPLERAVYQYLKAHSGVSLGAVARAVQGEATQAGARPRKLGLALSREASLLIRFAAIVPLLSVLLLGLQKHQVGSSRGRSVGILGALCVATVFALIALYRRPLWQTVRGGRAIRDLKWRNATLGYVTRRSSKDRLAGEDLVLAMGLFGVGVLATGAMQDLHRVFTPPPSSGGSSCAGGSSCGGCGGGGCGGCGG